MNNITRLQNEYLTTDSVDKRNTLLTDLYTNICKLGFFILEKEHYQLQEEDVLDLAADVIMRLMEKNQPIIKSAPSAYIKSALYFKQKNYFISKKPEPLDEAYISDDSSFEDEIVFDESLKEYQEEITQYADSIPTDIRLKPIIQDTILNQTSYKSIALTIDDLVLRKEYIKAMKKIYYYMKETKDAITETL